VTYGEHDTFGTRRQAAKALGEAACCVVQALAAGEGRVWAVSLDPRSKLSHRLPLQSAGIDVIEERFADQGGPVRARGESDLRGLGR